jgi:radical SAM protein with 4Fe4S-binding SPASM domain
MKTGKHFILENNCICVHGAKRAALYDLNSGDVFSIDPVSTQIIGLLGQGKTIDDVSQEVTACDKNQIAGYLKQLEENKLGKFSHTFEKPEEIQLSTEPYRKLDFIWLELREDCNLRCLHCYSESTAQEVKPGERLKFDDWKRLIKEAHGMECRKLQFIGGEPFLFGEKLFDLAAYARELGYEVLEIFSNLTVLKDRWLDLIEKYNIKIATSLYSKRPEVHDRITTRKGSFERTIKAVQKLKERNIPVRFGVTVMKHNQDYAEETMEFLKELGEENPGFDVARPCGRANDEELVPNKYQKWRLRDKAQFFQVEKEEFLKRYRGNSCWQGKISVSSTGDVMPCIMQRDDPAGNVNDMSLKDILDGKIQKYWSLSRDKISVCKDCEYRYACRDCRPVSYGPTGQLEAKDPTCLYDPYKGEFVTG